MKNAINTAVIKCEVEKYNYSWDDYLTIDAIYKDYSQKTDGSFEKIYIVIEVNGKEFCKKTQKQFLNGNTVIKVNGYFDNTYNGFGIVAKHISFSKPKNKIKK